MRDGFILPDSNHFLTLFTAAQAYLALGYSVIPLYGDVDPTRPKVAAVPWKDYQHTRPTDIQLYDWFIEHHFAALGIITGQISRLVVLDFDVPHLFEAFSRHCPDLAEHHVIQTQRGYHIYYQLPPNFNVQTRKGQGIDLLSDGCYVVARPSTINGHTYKLIRGGQPKLLTLDDIRRIKAFLENQATPVASSPPKRRITACQGQVETLQDVSSDLYTPVITSGDLSITYQRYVHQAGRNEALFRPVLRARDAGWSREDTVKALLELHVQQPPAHPHA